MSQLPAVRLMAAGDRPEPGRRGHDHGAAALDDGADGRARRPPVRARQALVDPRPPPRAGANVPGRATGGAPTTTATREGEALAVHEAAGLIDVSTLGKLIVRGPDAGELLDRLYPNRFSNLAPGRIRYGVLTSDAGRIIDDGTVCRLDDETFYVTTTSSGAGAVEQWFSWWLADWRPGRPPHRRHAGPGGDEPRRPAGARDPGARSPTPTAPTRGSRTSTRKHVARGGRAVPGRCASASWARSATSCTARPARRARSGTRCSPPAGRTERRSASSRSGILRLQKMHILVGQDTDSESTPFGAAMPLDRQARQGAGLHRQVGARARRASDPVETTLVGLHAARTATCRPRARSCSSTATARSAR